MTGLKYCSDINGVQMDGFFIRITGLWLVLIVNKYLVRWWTRDLNGHICLSIRHATHLDITLWGSTGRQPDELLLI